MSTDNFNSPLLPSPSASSVTLTSVGFTFSPHAWTISSGSSAIAVDDNIVSEWVDFTLCAEPENAAASPVAGAEVVLFPSLSEEDADLHHLHEAQVHLKQDLGFDATASSDQHDDSSLPAPPLRVDVSRRYPVPHRAFITDARLPFPDDAHVRIPTPHFSRPQRQFKLPAETTKKVYYCLYGCKKPFDKKNTWQKHLLSHTGVRDYSCKYGCGSDFTLKSNCQRHEKKCRSRPKDDPEAAAEASSSAPVSGSSRPRPYPAPTQRRRKRSN